MLNGLVINLGSFTFSIYSLEHMIKKGTYFSGFFFYFSQ
ncbi:MAG: hypothetical protein ACJAQ4_001822 [Cryomorphaceae bacterium]|jgi:hypothetical protein